MTENSKPPLETKEESCTKLRPICLRVPRGKEKMNRNCTIVNNTKDTNYNTVSQLKKISKYINNRDTDTGIVDKFEIVQFVDEKKIVRYVGDDNLQNCYSIELAWFIIINDIIRQIEVIKKELEPTNANANANAIANANANAIAIANPDKLDSSLELLFENTSKIEINIFAIFKTILLFGIKKWEFDNFDEEEKEINKLWNNKTELYRYLYYTSFLKQKNTTNDTNTSVIEIIEKNIDAKNHIIAFFLLHEFNQFINSEGFKTFSVLLQYSDLNKKMTELIPTLTAGQSTTGAPNIRECLSKINEIFKITFLFMNEKKDLTNKYIGKKFNINPDKTDKTDIYNTITGEFEEVIEFSEIYKMLVDKNEELKGKIEEKKIEQEKQTGGSKDEPTVIVGLALFIGKEIMERAASQLITGVLQSILSSQIINAVGVVLALSGPWGAAAVGLALLGYFAYKLYKRHQKLKKSVTNRYRELKKLLETSDNPDNKKKIITLFLKLQKQIVEEDLDDNKKKRDDAEKNVKKEIKETTKKLSKYSIMINADNNKKIDKKVDKKIDKKVDDTSIDKNTIEAFKESNTELKGIIDNFNKTKNKTATTYKGLINFFESMIKPLIDKTNTQQNLTNTSGPLIKPSKEELKQDKKQIDFKALNDIIENLRDNFLLNMIQADEAYRIDDLLLNKLDEKRKKKSEEDKEKKRKKEEKKGKKGGGDDEYIDVNDEDEDDDDDDNGYIEIGLDNDDDGFGITNMTIDKLKEIMINKDTEINNEINTEINNENKKNKKINENKKNSIDGVKIVQNFKNKIIEDLRDKFKNEIDDLKTNMSLSTESQKGGLISSLKMYEIKQQQKGRRRKYTLKKMCKRCKSSKHKSSKHKSSKHKSNKHKSSKHKSSKHKSSKRKSSKRKSNKQKMKRFRKNSRAKHS
jgi:hypothetical protein